MIRIAPVGLVVGLVLVAAGVVTCVTAPPDDPRAFPAIDDALILAGIAALALSSRRERLRAAPDARSNG